MTDKDPSLIDAIESDDDLDVLEALLRYVANELEGNRCDRCKASMLKTGDTASLVLRMQNLNKEVQDLRRQRKQKQAPNELPEGVTALERSRARRAIDPRSPDAGVDDPSKLGTRSAPRQQNGRQPRFKREGSA